MIETRLQGMWTALRQCRAADPGSAVRVMLASRTIPKMAAEATTHPLAKAYLYREIGRLCNPSIEGVA